MSWAFYLTFCFVQVLTLVNAMEDRDYTFEPFISIRLPYSVKRDEIINVPVKVFNYLDKDLDVEIVLDNSEAKYENIDFDNKVISEPKPSKSIQGLPPSNSTTVYFLIRPKVIGRVTLKVNAIYLGEIDTMHKTMNVVKEGVTQYLTFNFAVNLEMAYKGNIEKHVGLKSSRHTELGIVGDIMGLILNNLDNLVRIPRGCGEEKLSSLLPNYLVLKYLKNLRSLNPTIKAWLRHNLEIGFLKMLHYHNMDGSFSSFDPSHARKKPRDGSTLLTSYVLRFLPQFKEFTNVNETIIVKGLAYLGKQQAENGSFTEKGDYFYDSQRNPITITGSAVLAFLENPAYAAKYFQNIIKGLEFIANNLENYKLLHYHALDTYAANMAIHEGFEKKSPIKWLSDTSFDNQSKWWHYMFLSNVEITANNLLMLLDLNSTRIDNIERVVKRKIVQRKSLGFASTQQTIVALTELIKVSDVINYAPAKMDINIKAQDKNEVIKLTKDTEISYKSVELPPKTKLSVIAAKGRGSVLIEVAEEYDVLENQTSFQPSFIMNTSKLDKNNTYLKMLVCVRCMGAEKISKITLLEISTPTGYIINNETLKEIQKLKTVGAVLLKNSGSLLVVYFDHLYKNDETCLMLEALRTHAVVMQKPAAIQLYDYYDEGKRTIALYNVDYKLCDICVTQVECSFTLFQIVQMLRILSIINILIYLIGSEIYAKPLLIIIASAVSFIIY